MANNITTRRAVLGAMALASSAGAVPLMAAPPTSASDGVAANSYFAELDAYDAFSRRLNAKPHAETDWDRWEEWGCRLHSEIEALPPTPGNARIKARAIWSIVAGDMEDLNRGQCMVDRMIRQIVTSLAAGVN